MAILEIELANAKVGTLQSSRQWATGFCPAVKERAREREGVEGGRICVDSYIVDLSEVRLHLSFH